MSLVKPLNHMLELRDIVKIYPGPVPALQGISLTLHHGLFGLLGPNGSGKSTLMNILAGLLEPTSGEVTLDGEVITDSPQKIWPKLGFLPQDIGFYRNQTGQAMLMHLLRLKGITGPKGVRHVCGELLERVNLTSAAKRRIKTYSGGMIRRLGIAQAIAGNPQVLIVDEPTAGLDPDERMRFYRMLSEMAQDRIILLSTHSVADAAMVCPRLAILKKGKVLSVVSPSEARKRIEQRIFEGRVDRDTYRKVIEQEIVTQDYLVEGEHVVRIYRKDEAPPEGFTHVTPSFEDAYMLIQQEESHA